MRRFVLALTLTLCLAGCNRYSPEEYLLPREDISLTVKGELILTYDPLTFQLGYNDGIGEFFFFHFGKKELVRDGETLGNMMPADVAKRWKFILEK